VFVTGDEEIVAVGDFARLPATLLWRVLQLEAPTVMPVPVDAVLHPIAAA